jgi:hypothetical protein
VSEITAVGAIITGPNADISIGVIAFKSFDDVNSSSILSGSNIIAFADDNCSISTEEGPNPSFTIS